MVVCIVTVTWLSLGIVCVIPESVIVVVGVFDAWLVLSGGGDFGVSGSSALLRCCLVRKPTEVMLIESVTL